MKKCESCNLVLSRNDKYCPACGTETRQEQLNSVCFSVRLLGITVLSFIRKNEVNSAVEAISGKQKQKSNIVPKGQIVSPHTDKPVHWSDIHEERDKKFFRRLFGGMFLFVLVVLTGAAISGAIYN